MKMITAFILAMVQVGKEREAIKELHRIHEVKSASPVYGDYDVFAAIEANDLDHLNEVVIKKIRNAPYINATNTLIKI